jgi:hypothetical protein
MEDEKKSESWIWDILECSDLIFEALVYVSKGLIRLVVLLCEFLGNCG